MVTPVAVWSGTLCVCGGGLGVGRGGAGGRLGVRRLAVAARGGARGGVGRRGGGGVGAVVQAVEARRLLTGTGYDVPVDLRVASVDAGSGVTVAWTDKTVDEWRFRVQRSMTADFRSVADNYTVAANVTSAVLPAGFAGSYVRVRAERGDAMSPWSSVLVPGAGGTGGTAVLDAPTNARVVAAGDGVLKLTWTDNSSSEWRFRVQRSTSAAFATDLVNLTVSADATSFTATGLAAGTTYYFRVRAENGPDMSAWASAVGTASAASHVLAAPSDLSVADEVYNAGVLDVRWSDNSDNETGFTLLRSTTADFSGLPVAIRLPAGTTSYRATGLDPWTVYYYRVYASNSAGTSGPSNADFNRTADDGTRPGVVVSDLPATGGWVVPASGGGYNGGGFISDNNQAQGQLTYRVDAPGGVDSGQYYRIDVWYPAVSGAASNARFAIDSDDPAVHEYQGRSEFTVDERANAGQWVTVGTKLNPYLEVSNAGTDGVVTLGAVRFTPVDLQNQIIDLGPTTLTGPNWTQVTDPKAVGGSYWTAPAFSYDANNGGGNFASTAPLAPSGHYGTYDVYVRYHASATFASNVPVSAPDGVLSADSLTSVDERTQGDKWVRVGTMTYGFWNNPSISLGNLGVDGPVSLDAVLFRPISFTT